MLRRPLFLALLAVALSGAPSGCKSSEVPGAGTNAPMGLVGRVAGPSSHWSRSRSPQVPKTVSAELRAASKLLVEGRALSADRKLATISDGAGRHWVAVARADLASLYFTKCIRGVAWRLEDLDPQAPPERSIDYDPQTRIEAGDVSVEAMLTNLDDATRGRETRRCRCRLASPGHG